MPPDFVVGTMIRHYGGREAIIVAETDFFLHRRVWAMFVDGSHVLITRFNSDNWDIID